MPGLTQHVNDTTIEVRALGALPPVRRRTWAHPELTSHSLLVLTPDRVYLAPLAGDPKAETVSAIASGADLDSLLGSLATTIDLVAVSRVRLDLQSNSLIIEYVGRGLGASRVTITFTTPEAADACFSKLWRRLGDGMKLDERQRDKWHLARTPLILLFSTLAVTAALALVLSVFEDFASARAANKAGVTAVGPLGEPVEIPKTPLESLIGWISWKYVCAVGGIVAAGSQVWLYRRLTTPPVSLEIARGD